MHMYHVRHHCVQIQPDKEEEELKKVKAIINFLIKSADRDLVTVRPFVLIEKRKLSKIIRSTTTHTQKSTKYSVIL